MKIYLDKWSEFAMRNFVDADEILMMQTEAARRSDYLKGDYVLWGINGDAEIYIPSGRISGRP